MNPRRITLSIDRISIAGGGAHDKRALIAAIQGELRTILSRVGAADSLGKTRWSSRLDAGTTRPTAPGEQALGSAVARATVGALNQ